MNKVLYLLSGRNVSSHNPGRKISSIINCWRMLGYEVQPVFGGDLHGGTPTDRAGYSQASYHFQWYRRIKVLDPLVRSVSERRDILHNEGTVKYLSNLTKMFSPDLIWERSTRLHCAGLEVAKKIGVPYVFEWMDNVIPYSLSIYRAQAQRIEKRKMRLADFVVVVSDALRNALIQGNVHSNRIVIVRNAVDPKKFMRSDIDRKEKRKELGIGEDQILIGYLGSYAFYHDTTRLVLAADILRRRHAGQMKVLMVGAGKEYPQARKIAEESGLLGSFLRMEPVVPPDQVPGILAALDIAILPGSTDIICPIKIQEYMASELATVAPDYPCNREVIRNEVTGMLFEPKNERALAETISVLVQDAKMRARLGWESRQDVLRRFTWEKTWGKALEDIFRDI